MKQNRKWPFFQICYEIILFQLMDLKVGSSGGGGGGGGNHGGNRDGGRRGKGSQRGNQPQQSNDENDWNTVPMRQQRANNERIGM